MCLKDNGGVVGVVIEWNKRDEKTAVNSTVATDALFRIQWDIMEPNTE